MCATPPHIFLDLSFSTHLSLTYSFSVCFFSLFLSFTSLYLCCRLFYLYLPSACGFLHSSLPSSRSILAYLRYPQTLFVAAACVSKFAFKNTSILTPLPLWVYLVLLRCTCVYAFLCADVLAPCLQQPQWTVSLKMIKQDAPQTLDESCS